MTDEKKPDVMMVAQQIMSDALTKFEDYPNALQNISLQLAQEREKSFAVIAALHDAINRPMGVVPDSAAQFYQPNAANQRAAIDATLN